MGVKRIFIKIADDAAACSLFVDACSTTTTNIYKNKGIEPWAWSYNYPGNNAAQADALYQAQTQRAVQNFQLSPLRLPPGFIRALLLIKRAAAIANQQLGLLDAPFCNAFARRQHQ